MRVGKNQQSINFHDHEASIPSLSTAVEFESTKSIVPLSILRTWDKKENMFQVDARKAKLGFRRMAGV